MNGNGNQQQIGGILIDPDGVLTMKRFRDPTGELTRQRIREAQAKLAPDMLGASPLRKISLNRLEAVLAKRIAGGEFESDDMRFLAGLTGITHVFFYPDSGDIVIAGPAEGFYLDLSGRPVGMHTGRAILELQDLVAALRAYPPTGERTSVISVSIDPTQEGLANLQQFLNQVGSHATPNMTAQLAEGSRRAMGRQNVTIKGVSDRTHFAQILAEADYRMKLISIGLEKTPVKIVSYVERVNPRVVSRNALARFYFTPEYECVTVAEDGFAMQMKGKTVKLVTERELVAGDGARSASAAKNKAAEQFAQSFTDHYPELAQRSPVYAQLKNLIDISVFIQQQDYYGQSGWQLGVLGDEKAFPIENHPAPKFVESAVNAIWKGNVLMTPVGGGINIQPRQALVSDRLQRDHSGDLQKQRAQVTLDGLAPDQWWWD
jgi:hypothetical protein